jgi:hypothetical protein
VDRSTLSDPFLFVSHVSEDRAEAMEIVAALERRNICCWIAPRDVQPGHPFDDEISAAIDDCRAMLLVFSDRCNDSEYIRREVTVAGESQKLVIPFRIENAQPKHGLRVRLADLHWIDGFVAREQAVDAVAQALGLNHQAEEEARRQAEEEARRQAEEEARRQAEEEARRQAEEEARRQAEEEARRTEELKTREPPDERLRDEERANQDVHEVTREHRTPLRRPPRTVRGVPSVFGYAWSEQNTIIMEPSSANIPIFPVPSSENNHTERLETCRTLVEDLVEDLDNRQFNVRDDYKSELKKYASRLPSEPEDRNILLADAAARTVRDLFAAEVDFLPAPFAARLKTILEQHIGLRAYYPEIETFYRDVRSGRLQKPLPLDAFTSVIRAVKMHTPDVFDPSVVSAIDESTDPGPTATPQDELSTHDANQPVPPPDPLGELDPAKAHDYQVAGIVNRLWQVFEAGETLHKALHGWHAAYASLAPPVTQVLDWLLEFVRSKFGG